MSYNTTRGGLEHSWTYLGGGGDNGAAVLDAPAQQQLGGMLRVTPMRRMQLQPEIELSWMFQVHPNMRTMAT